MADTQRWEYLTVPLTHLDDDALGKYGADGWEAVCTIPEWPRDTAMLFKRPLAPTTKAGR